MEHTPPVGSGNAPAASAAPAGGGVVGYRGDRLGLPERGPGSLAGVGARLLAVALDWLASLLVVRLLFPGVQYGTTAYAAMTLLVFAVEVALLTWLGGGSFGQRLCRLRVARLDGVRVQLWRAVVRTVLIVLVVPAAVWDRDGRGLHDKAVGTAVVRI